MKGILIVQRLVLCSCWLITGYSSGVFADSVSVKMGFLTEQTPTPPALSNLDSILTDEGIQGAVLGISDNNRTGQFTGHDYHLKHESVPVGGNVLQAFDRLLREGYQYVIADVRASTLKKLSPIALANKVLLFNASSTDVELRNASCGANTFHMIPSDAMKADALAQFMFKTANEN